MPQYDLSKEELPQSLDHFDMSLRCRTATLPAIFSVALMDEICPPSTACEAPNHSAGPKQIRTFPFNGDEGGQLHIEAEQLVWLKTLLKDDPAAPAA